MSDAFKPRTMKRKNVKGLALNAPATAPEPSAGDAQIPGGIGNSVGSMDTLEIGVEFQLDLKTDEFEMLKELGAGNGGTVSKVMHPATKIVMARKVRSAAMLQSQGADGSDHPRRGKGGCAQEHCSGAAHHEGLQLSTHRDLLRCLPQRHRRRHHVHGVHGCRVSTAGLFFGVAQADESEGRWIASPRTLVPSESTSLARLPWLSSEA
jgi:hypothetical protein